MPNRIAVDVGGTFTDFVTVDAKGEVIEAKTPSTPKNPAEALRSGLEELAAKREQGTSELLADCTVIIIGSTVALNTLLQYRGAKTGLICTDGFRDSLEIRLGYRDIRHDIRHLPPPPLVPRELRLTVRERVDKTGYIRLPLNEADVHKAVAAFREARVEAVAVCLLWSFLNPAHERRIGEIVRSEMPDSYLSLSVDVAPQIREYDRSSTTVLNAYVGPRFSTYLDQTERFLRELGFGGEIRYTQSNGGLASADLLRSRAILALNSGPAAAPAAGLFFGRRLGTDNLITVDMGGTSFDACLIERGTPDVRGSVDVNHYRLAAPMVNINTIGAGGGSIAWIEHGLLKVGPQSAEVVPGPACYMRGGIQPTVTDADLVLGYLNQSALLGGRFKIDPLLAHSAIESDIADPLGVSVAEAALGIYKIVNRNMAHAISEVSLERGYDPREFTLVAAGGQGALHAAELARELSIANVVIPRVASTFCAFGALAADLRHDYKRSFTCRLMDADLDRLRLLFEDMEQEGRADLLREGCMQGDIAIVRHLEMRYVGQIFDVAVDVSTLDWSSDVYEALQELLHRQHEKEYTYRLEDAVAEVMNASVAAVGRLPELSLPLAKRHSNDSAGALRNRRRALVGPSSDYQSIPIYDGTLLRAGNVLSGPAVVEEPNTTILVLSGFEIELTRVNAYVMRQVS